MKKILAITATERCNLNCIYCYERNKTTEIIDVEKTKQIISDFLDTIEETDDPQIDFHGGEVILAFNEISTICDFFWSKDKYKNLKFHAMTNGTLVHGQFAEWFLVNKDRFTLRLSLDGTKVMQDINRTSSYDKINIKYFANNWKGEPVKMTISPDTIGDICDGVVHLYDIGFDSIISNLAYGMQWDNTDPAIYERELSKLIDFLLENPEFSPPSMLGLPISRIGIKSTGRNVSMKWCGVGEYDVFLSPKGERYPCQGFMPSATLSEEYVDYFKLIDFTDYSKFTDEKCAECVFSPACSTCCAYDFRVNGSVSNRVKDMCHLRKVEIFASAYLLAKMLKNPEKYTYTRNLPEKTISNILRGINVLYSS